MYLATALILTWMKASCCRIVIFSRLIRSSSDSAELRTAFSVFWRRKGKYTIRYFQTSSGIQWTSALEKGQKQGIGRRKRDGVEVIGFAGKSIHAGGVKQGEEGMKTRGR